MDFIADVRDWLYHISPALLTVVVGGIAIQLLFIQRANAAVFVDGIIKELEILKTDALEYWNIDPLEDGEKRCPVLEQKIKGSVISIGNDISHLCKKFWYRQAQEQLDELHFALADEATGGLFESADRKVETLKYLKIVNAANQLRSRLMMTKL